MRGAAVVVGGQEATTNPRPRSRTKYPHLRRQNFSHFFSVTSVFTSGSSRARTQWGNTVTSVLRPPISGLRLRSVSPTFILSYDYLRSSLCLTLPSDHSSLTSVLPSLDHDTHRRATLPRNSDRTSGDTSPSEFLGGQAFRLGSDYLSSIIVLL